MKFLLLIFFSYIFTSLHAQSIDSLIVHAKPETTVEQFNQLLQTNKYVLVDFYADWCAPCKKLAPIIQDISKEYSSTVLVIKVNQDENKPLFDLLQVWELPTLRIYRNGKILWSGEGFFPKEVIEEQLK